MKIYYSPEFTGNAYFSLKNSSDIALDTMVCGSKELLSALMLRLGIHDRNLSPAERQNAYYLAFKECDAEENDNLFHDSFSIGELSVSNECLKWRDKLILAHWDKTMSQPSKRLEFMAHVEEKFSAPGDADYWMQVIAKLTSSQKLGFDLEIDIVFIKRNLLPPYITEVLNQLERLGATIVETDFPKDTAETNLGRIKQYLRDGNGITISAPDDTFRILSFPDETTALQYVASVPSADYDLYINSDNKNFDDLLNITHQPATGSSVVNENPQILQTFKIGLSLFDFPINIYNVLSWLLLPQSPIGSGYRRDEKPRLSLRRHLSNALLESNGLFNDKWDEAIDKFRQGAVDDKELAEMNKCIDNLKVLVPRPISTDVNRDTLSKFVAKVKKWAKLQSESEHLSEMDKSHFVHLLGLFTTFENLLGSYQAKTLPYSQIEKWMLAIYEPLSYPYMEAQQGCRHVVASPADIVTTADNILWMDFYNYEAPQLTYEFLNPTEKSKLADLHCNFGSDNLEAEFNDMLYLIPILSCNRKFTAITVKRRNADATNPHPLNIRLKQSLGKDSYQNLCSEGSIESLVDDADILDNGTDEVEITISKAADIEYRKKESPSSLENLLQYPFDYVMQYLAKVSERKATELKEVRLVKGLVAHKVIQMLCGGEEKDISTVRATFDGQFDTVFEQAITQEGAILNLRQNLLEKQTFRNKLKQTVGNLLDIISENQLTVVACEGAFDADISLDPKTEVGGRIDMILSNNGGGTIIFDFKWSDTDSDFYKKKIENNHALQLEVYKALLENNGKNVVAKGYYIMPRSTLFTCNAECFPAKMHVVQVNPSQDVDILTQIRNGYSYRLNQIAGGSIEMGEGTPLEGLAYASSTVEQNLYPLAEGKSSQKDTNQFSSYKVLKGELK
jgi:hypothetical protein